MTMKLGIWCDYGVTLEPSEGIGVFVANLVQGLVHQPSISKIVLVSKEGQENLLAPLKRLDENLIEVIGNSKPPFYLRKPWKLLRKADRKSIQQTGRGIEGRQGFQGMVYRWLQRQIYRSKSSWLEGVDLWLLPYVGLDQDFAKPTVVIVHDLVTYHYSDAMPADKLESFKRLVDQVTGRAKIVACMSNFILQNDLHGTLGLPEHRTRMVRPAVPKDFAFSATVASTIPPELPSGNYLLYPAAFRSYKNHALLLKALPELNRNQPSPLHVVFTGITQTPADLKQIIEQLDIQPWVHVLGKVSRGQLEALYRHAFATAVPSLYEQGSFPLMESLGFGCPILSSDIPSLREQLQAMQDDAMFFDPHSIDSFVAAVRRLQLDRSGSLAKQLSGFERMKQRSWEDVAGQWCEVFQQAIDPA